MTAERPGVAPTLVVAFPDQDRIVESVEFAAFWRDEFGTVHFYARHREWWDEWFDSHSQSDALPLVEHDDGGNAE